MPQHKKKKKAGVNPSRGFATTSVPSKAKTVNESDTTPDAPDVVPEKEGLVNGQPASGTQNEAAPPQADDIKAMSPEELESHLEDSELQALVDQYALRSMADVSRQVTKIENEKRQLRSQAHKLTTSAWINDAKVDEIFSLSAGEPLWPHSAFRGSSPPLDEAKLTIDLWILEEVLQRLKLPRVSEALQAIADAAVSGRLRTSSESVYGLEEAVDWYGRSALPHELRPYEEDLACSVAEHEEEDAARPELDTKPTDQEDDRPLPTTPAPVADEPLSPGISSDDSDDDNDPTKLTAKYLHLQWKIWKIQNGDLSSGAEGSKSQQKLDALKNRAQRLRRDPLFDEHEADVIWASTLADLQAERAEALRKKARAARTHGKERMDPDKSHGNAVTIPAEPGQQVPDDDCDASLLRGIFASGDDADAANRGVPGQHSVKVLDFGKWTGASPKQLLEEVCKDYDPRSKVTIRRLQSPTWSSRHSLTISWSMTATSPDIAGKAVPQEVVTKITQNAWSLEMVRVAAANVPQSEAYICTLGLFLVSSARPGEFKLGTRLPSAWRNLAQDLTDEMQKQRKEEQKASLRRIRALVHDAQLRLSVDQSQTRASDQFTNTLRVGQLRAKHLQHAREDPDKVMEDWHARVSRPAFTKWAEVRSQLPVHHFKIDILACISNHAVSVICAETGAGKSSGIPVLILEQNFSRGEDCHILVTQPRRISAVTLARRVSQELGENKQDVGTTRSLVGYAIRLESKTSSTTRITYATTGVLLRMLESSPNLEELDYLILDEVHERTMDLDLLFIALRRLQERRKTLKIILMSATVDAKKLSYYFAGAPILDLPGRLFPVEVGFLEDAVEATDDFRGPAHHDVPEQDEWPEDSDFYREAKSRPIIADHHGYSDRTRQIVSRMDEYRLDYSFIVKLAGTIASKPRYAEYSKAILIFMPGLAEMRRLHRLLLSTETFDQGWVIHLLHSTFSTEDLEKAFERPRRGVRKIVIATNIAETGITIPDVTAVIDTCREKVMRFDERRQLSRLTENFVSRTSARQRRGRAARVQDGLCFHLVTKYRHDNLMQEQQVPEMLRLSLQDSMLRIKVWNLGSIEQTFHEAIDPPLRKNVLRAIERLKDAGALTKKEELTDLGHQISRIPLDVSLAKLAVLGVILRCVDPILAVIALMTSKSPFLSVGGTGAQTDARQSFRRGDSDLLSSLNAYEGWRKAKRAGRAQEYCRKAGINDQAMLQVELQKIQLLVYLVDAGMVALVGDERSALGRARTATGGRESGELYSLPARFDRKLSDQSLNAMIAVALYPRVLRREGQGWRNVYTNQQVALTSRSINHNNSRGPGWMSYYEAMQNQSGSLRVFETSPIPESALALLLGEADFKCLAGVIVLDTGKVKLSVKQWRQLTAIKILREQLRQALESCYRRLGEEGLEKERTWLDLWLGIDATPAETLAS